MIRLALIGCKGCPDDPTLLSRLEGTTIAAVADDDLEAARAKAHALGAPIVARSLDELLASFTDELDAVVIPTPNSTHGDLVEKAAQAGKHVLVETPLASTIESADAAIEACRSAGVKLMVGQATRFLPSQQTVKASLKSGKLGAAGLLRIHRWQALDQGRSGTPILSRAIAEIDLAHWLFEALPTEVYAVGRCRASAALKAPDYVQVHLGFPEGGMALIDEARYLPTGTDYYSVSLIGGSGAAYADDHHNMNLRYRGGTPHAIKNGEGNLHVVAQLNEFVAAIEADREPTITGADGRAAIQIAVAAAESMESGRAAHLTGGRYELV